MRVLAILYVTFAFLVLAGNVNADVMSFDDGTGTDRLPSDSDSATIDRYDEVVTSGFTFRIETSDTQDSFKIDAPGTLVFSRVTGTGFINLDLSVLDASSYTLSSIDLGEFTDDNDSLVLTGSNGTVRTISSSEENTTVGFGSDFEEVTLVSFSISNPFPGGGEIGIRALNVTAVPEPTHIGILTATAIGLGVRRRRKASGQKAA